eukprot:jgi/Ulvmu1/1365/UM011_0093.1
MHIRLMLLGKLRNAWMPRASFYAPARSLRKPRNGLTTAEIAHLPGNGATHPTNGATIKARATAYERWDRITTSLVDYSTVAFTFLLLPQLFKNALALKAGNAASLAGLSWLGFMTALMGNTQLLGYFLDKGERSAAAIQGIGVISNYGVLFQVAVAGHMPPSLPPALIAACLVSLSVLSARASGALQPASRAWHAWQALMAVVGIITVPQVLWTTFFDSSTLLPAAIATVPAVVLLGMDATGRLTGRLQRLWGALSAWTATLLFCCQPIAQLAANFVRPEGVASLSLATLLLATLGNSMMVPRALLKRDVIWLTGTAWGVAAYGWGNLLTMARAHHLHGIGGVTLPLFAAVTAAMIVYFGAVLRMDAKASRSAAKQA